MAPNRTVYLEEGGTTLCTYDETKLTFEPVWEMVFAITICVNLMAVIGNIVVILACFTQNYRAPLLIYILALAFSDCCYALISPLYAYRYIIAYWTKLTINFSLAGRLSHHLTLIANTFSSFSCWLVVTLTIDRMIIARFPFKASTLRTAKRAILTLVLIFMCCSILNGIWLFEFFQFPISINPCTGYWKIPTEVVKNVPGTNSTTVVIPIRYQKAYQVYTIFSAVTFLYALPVALMICCNIIIIRQIKKGQFNPIIKNTDQLELPRSKSRSQSNKPKNQEDIRRSNEIQLTKMIVTVSVIFVICNLPDIATRLAWKFVSPRIVSSMEPVAHLFLMVNAGANFFVYAKFHQRLFNPIKRACCCCIMKKRKGSSDNLAPGLSLGSINTVSTSATAVSSTLSVSDCPNSTLK